MLTFYCQVDLTVFQTHFKRSLHIVVTKYGTQRDLKSVIRLQMNIILYRYYNYIYCTFVFAGVSFEFNWKVKRVGSVLQTVHIQCISAVKV